MVRSSSSSPDHNSNSNKPPKKMKIEDDDSSDSPTDEDDDSLEEYDDDSESYEEDSEEETDSEKYQFVSESDEEDDDESEDDSGEQENVFYKEEDILKENMNDLPKPPGSFSRLPRNIFLNILSRVPIKPLCRSRLVSKAWFATVRHPSFAKLHLSKLLSNPKNPQSVIFLDYNGRSYIADHTDFDKLKTSIELHDLNIPHRNPDSFKISSCHGLLFTQESLCISNPITGESKKLPKPFNFNSEKTPVVSGFGFDPIAKRYKVLLVYDKITKIVTIGKGFRLGSWRLSKWHEFMFRDAPGVFFKGAFHWIAFEKPKPWPKPKPWAKPKPVIVTFDIHTEKFGTIEFPPRHPHDDTYMYLLVLGGCLCLVEKEDEMCTQIWAMRKYGDAKSWKIKYGFYEIAGFDDVVDNCVEANYDPIQMMRNGDLLLLWCNEYLGYYGRGGGTARAIEIHGDAYNCVVHPLVHVASLISPHSI